MSDSPPNSYETAYFQVTGAQVAGEGPFDIVIIGSGIGGGVLAASLLEKNHLLQQSVFHPDSTGGRDPRKQPVPQKPTPDDGTPDDGAPQPLKILVVEKGRLIFHTHCLNGPRPSNSGTTSQGNDLFFETFKNQFDIDDKTTEGWAGGPVFCVGGRAAVWGLFSPRVSIDTLCSEFPDDVSKALLDEYYSKAEEMMKIAYPTTLPPHQALIDRLNLRTSIDLPFTQWEWGRVASEFRDRRNYDFAEGAFSTIDTLLEAAMNDPEGKNDPNFRTVLNVPVVRLEPTPQPNEQTEVTHVVIQDGSVQRKIACKQAVICAGSVESAAILLRSVDGNPSKYGPKFAEAFGHITDHRIFSVASPFFYHYMEDRDVIGAMKLQTDIQFNIQKDGKTVDDTTALVNISLDSSSFLPRTDVRTGDLPILLITYILPSALALKNKIKLNKQKEPHITFDWAEDEYLEDKKQVMKNFAVDIMNKIVDVLDIHFAKATEEGYSPMLSEITVKDIELKAAGPGVVAHELGSIPMPPKDGSGGIVDSDLEMQYSWNNVSVCDLSVFPYSPAANPTLTLAALALRLSDKLFPDPRYSPIIVYNLTGDDVYVKISNSKKDSPSFGPSGLVKIASGDSETWKIAQREVMSIYSSEQETSYDVQMVYPGINAMIVNPPPKN